MKKIRLYPSLKEVPYEEGQTVLAALEKSGLALPNNCRAGACGECKVKVRAGKFDQGLVLDMALSQEEREEGYGLMCMAKVLSDTLEIEWGTEDAMPKLFPPQENRPYIVIEKRLVTPSIVKLRLQSLGKPMRFWPGQYVSLGDSDNGIPQRCYSIANIPNESGEIVLFVTKIKDGKASQWIHDKVCEGEQLSVSGPYGTFIGDPSTETPVLCLAAGSGLAPIMSLAQGALMRGGFRYPATILFSARTQKDLYEQGLFSFMQARFRNFKFQYTLTKEKGESNFSGRIPDVLEKHYPDLSNYSLYIAGSPTFVENCVKKCKALGAKEELIHTEGFTAQVGPTTPPKERMMS